MFPFLTTEMLGWIGVYILIGFVYVFLRFNRNKDKMKKEIESRNLHNHPLFGIAFPLAMIFAVLTWPHLMGSFIWRKLNEYWKK